MPTGDGLLVRLTPTGTISLRAFAALCTGAHECGNGIIEVTARGNIQVRGLTAVAAPRFASAVAALGIAAADGVPVLSDPLAGLDADELIDASALAADLRAALARTSLAARLDPKVSVAIDGGSALGLSGLSADVRLCAQKTNGEVTLRVGIGGDEANSVVLGTVAVTDGVEAAIRLLDVITRRGSEVRARDVLLTEGVGVFQFAIAGLLCSARPRESGDPELDARFRGNERSKSIGAHPLRGGTLASGIGLAFGHSDATVLRQLAGAANDAGARGFRPAPDRVLVAIGLVPDNLAMFSAAADQLGFIVHADDPRRAVIACAGAPICASAHIAARAIAPAIAAAAARRGGAFKIHLSGCAKGCAHPAPAALTVVGTPSGCALITDGTARDAAFDIIAADELPAAVAAIARDIEDEARHV